MHSDSNETLEKQGLPVLACAPNAPGAVAGVRSGDRLLEVNGHAVSDIDTFLAAKLRNPKLMQVKLLRAGEILHLTIPFNIVDDLKDEVPGGVGAMPWTQSTERVEN